jgi:hypothetical protein
MARPVLMALLGALTNRDHPSSSRLIIIPVLRKKNEGDAVHIKHVAQVKINGQSTLFFQP